MMETELLIINKLGLHARAAAKLVTLAAEFNSEILLERDTTSVNAKSIMGVMMLAASKGTRLRLRTEGDDEHQASQRILELVNNRFGEPE